jgi:hypothetical protein
MTTDIPGLNPNVPNAARIYDYLLGGTRNFEADRGAAEYMASLLPSTRKWLRMLRDSLGQYARQLSAEGFTHFIDFGSGLPDRGHLHAAAPSAKVVYSDKDPATVAQARALLGDTPNVLYLQHDLRQAKELLESDEVRAFLDGERKIAFGASGITDFLSEAELRKLASDLYSFAAPGSKLFITFETKDPNLSTPRWEQFVGMFQQMGEPFSLHPIEAYLDMCRPWTVDAHGVVPVAKLLGHPDDYVTEADREGVGIEFYAVILEKK